MPQINCYIPIKLRITGRLSDAQLEQLGETLIRSLTERIAFAERTIASRQNISVTSGVEQVKEPVDELRLQDQTYTVPVYDREGQQQALPVESSDLPLLADFHSYAFFFAGGAYGRAAEAYISEFYPDHHRYRTRSFEQMFHILAQDIRRRTRHSANQIRISEIVIVTHANAAGGMKIPLTNDRRRRTFTPWDLVDLQQEFRRGLYRRFREERREVVAALDENTRLVVRGCNFGQSQEALDALRAFFGGEPLVFAPLGYQGFEVLPIGGSLLRTPEDAFDFLVQQEYLPADQIDLAVEEKRRYIREVFGSNIPAQFFIISQEDYDQFKQLTQPQRLGPAAEELIRRPIEEDEPDFNVSEPHLGVTSSGERFWALSEPAEQDPELDALSIEELEARARQLNNPYRPENAAMLVRLREAWSRKLMAGPIAIPNTEEPLGGLPDSEIFGSPSALAIDAARYPAETPRRDIFEEETLPYQRPTPEQRQEAQEFDEVEQVLEAVAAEGGSPETQERHFSPRGQIETLSDGIRLWNFSVGSPRLRSQFRSPLNEIAQQAVDNPNLVVNIEGHTSSSGSAIANEFLSLERANSVRQFLIDTGVPASQILVSGNGERNLLVRERNRDGELVPRQMAKNRRVEIHLISSDSSTSSPRPELDDEDSMRARESGEVLGREASREMEQSESDAFSDVLTATDLTNSLLGYIASIAEIFLLEFLTIPLGVVISFVSLEITLNRTKNAQIQGLRKFGAKLGLQAAEHLPARALKNNVTAEQLEEIIHQRTKLQKDWDALAGLSYPLGVERATSELRQTLAKVAEAINETMRWAEGELSRRLAEAGVNADEIERIIDEKIDRLRVKLLVELIKEGLRILDG